MNEIDWPAIQKALAEPFPPCKVHWRVQGTPNAQDMALVLAYLDARDIWDRLDSAVGAGYWAASWEPVVTSEAGLLVAKATIIIHGVPKSDVGDASAFEGNKGTVSDAYKRAGVLWGIGRYLYDLPSPHVKAIGGKLSKETLDDLCARLSLWQQKRTTAA